MRGNRPPGPAIVAAAIAWTLAIPAWGMEIPPRPGAPGIAVPAPIPEDGVEDRRPVEDPGPPPAWMKFLGWSSDATRIAWREGAAGGRSRPGDPVRIARLDESGVIVDRLFVRDDVSKYLQVRRIRVANGNLAQTEQVTPADVVLRVKSGRLFAVAVRGQPAQVAVLEKRADGYEPVALMPVRSPTTQVRAEGWESPDGRLVAFVMHSGNGASRQATLVVVPAAPARKRGAP